jgi:predicted nucleic-acid-binding protein
MIGIDTNVLVRYLTQDDAAQARKVDTFVAEAMESNTRIHIDDIVLCESVWVLRAAYKMAKSQIVTALDRILSTALFSFDARESLREALDDYRDGSSDFSDYLIGRRNAHAGCDHTITFDRLLRDAPTFLQL